MGTVLEHCGEIIGTERLLFVSVLPHLEAAMALGRVLTTRLSNQHKEMVLRNNFHRILDEPDS